MVAALVKIIRFFMLILTDLVLIPYRKKTGDLVSRPFVLSIMDLA